ncbi:MAG: hypothetical protein B6D62_03200 [Candidatus Cloacimonas sp. 4484_275]|nr:MAG: hypothetical protein B6D62_03200 [Candidatus Cloacimonas sp. 4484_275]
MSNKPILNWISYPFKDNPATSVLLILFYLIISIGLWQIAVVTWEMPLFFYLGILVFTISLLPYFIPTKYEFFDDKIVITYFIIKVEKKYSDFRCYYADKKGVMLGTFSRPRRLDNFRGQSIRFSKTQEEKERLFKLLDEKIGKRF